MLSCLLRGARVTFGDFDGDSQVSERRLMGFRKLLSDCFTALIQ